MVWITYWYKYLSGKMRIFYGFCPLCNSDAPEVYDCPLCEGYQQASGDKYPPTKETKAEWWGEWAQVIRLKKMTQTMVKESRKARLKSESDI